MSSSENSELLNLPIPPSLLTLLPAPPLDCVPAPEDDDEAPEDDEDLKKLVMMDQSMVSGDSISMIRDMRPPS